MSSNRIEDYKSFLRFHLDESGQLTVYVIGFKQVIRSWVLNADRKYSTEVDINDYVHMVDHFSVKK